MKRFHVFGIGVAEQIAVDGGADGRGTFGTAAVNEKAAKVVGALAASSIDQNFAEGEDDGERRLGRDRHLSAV